MRSTLYFALIAFVATFPLLVLILYALAPGWAFPEVLPARFDPRAVDYVLGQWRPLLVNMASSVGYSLACVGVTLIMCLAPAHALARRSFRGKSLLEGLLLAPALVPAMTFSMGVHWAFIRLGLADTFPGLVLVLAIFSYPYMLRALIAGYEAVGEDFELCAANLGAGRAARFLRLELPLLMPSVLAGGSVVFLVAFSEYFLVFLIGGGAVPSYTGYLFPFLNGSDRAIGALLTLIFLAVPVALFLLMELVMARVYRRRGLY